MVPLIGTLINSTHFYSIQSFGHPSEEYNNSKLHGWDATIMGLVVAFHESLGYEKAIS